LETITCALLRIPLPTQDDSNCVDRILGNAILKILQKAAPSANYCRCIELYKNNKCFNCMTLYGKAHNQPYLGIQNLEPNPELNTIAKAKNTFTYSSIEEFPIESLEAFDSSMLLGKDFSPMRSSSLHLKIGDNANFTSRRENLNTNYNL
jgi:hypothetical protein